GYLRRSLSAANATTPLSTPSAVTTLPASISGTASTHAYALLANRSTAQPIRAQWNFFMPISSRASDLTEKLLAAKPLGSQCDHAAEYPKRSYRASRVHLRHGRCVRVGGEKEQGTPHHRAIPLLHPLLPS